MPEESDIGPERTSRRADIFVKYDMYTSVMNPERGRYTFVIIKLEVSMFLKGYLTDRSTIFLFIKV